MRYNRYRGPFWKPRRSGLVRLVRQNLGREKIYMRKIRKKILTDNAEKPIAVQIDYTDWLEIERSLNLQGDDARDTDLSSYEGIITLSEEPLGYQSRIRQEWS
jgi:hypothetical protein